mmetsp:Transcript_109181/g.309528  ORF Transcript_109181/g.309528 Transcript_109181/m.309528 type:complete len:97 (+) Transcript_109181:621-911(+)
MGEMHTNLIAHVAALYGLNMVADTLKSINAFEIVYNGQVLHSKLSSGKFPEPGEVTEKLAAILGKEKPRTGRPAAAPEAAPESAGRTPPEPMAHAA